MLSLYMKQWAKEPTKRRTVAWWPATNYAIKIQAYRAESGSRVAGSGVVPITTRRYQRTRVFLLRSADDSWFVGGGKGEVLKFPSVLNLIRIGASRVRGIWNLSNTVSLLFSNLKNRFEFLRSILTFLEWLEFRVWHFSMLWVSFRLVRSFRFYRNLNSNNLKPLSQSLTRYVSSCDRFS